jgi:chromosome segregation ATPase
VSGGPTEPSAGLKSARDTIGELRSAHDDFETFFGDVFEQLESLSIELFARHRCLQSGASRPAARVAAAATAPRQFNQCLAELRRMQAEIRRNQQEARRTWAEIAADQRQLIETNAQLAGHGQRIIGLMEGLAKPTPGAAPQPGENCSRQSGNRGER